MTSNIRMFDSNKTTPIHFTGGSFVSGALFILLLTAAMFLMFSTSAQAQSQCHQLNANSMEDFTIATSNSGQVCIELKGLTPGESYIQFDTVYNFTTPTRLGYDVRVEVNNDTIYSRNVFLQL